MNYTLWKRTTSGYVLQKDDGVNRFGIASGVEDVACFNTLKEAREFCEKNNITYIKATEPKGCRW